jgi:hypothetical protein
LDCAVSTGTAFFAEEKTDAYGALLIEHPRPELMHADTDRIINATFTKQRQLPLGARRSALGVRTMTCTSSPAGTLGPTAEEMRSGARHGPGR